MIAKETGCRDLCGAAASCFREGQRTALGLTDVDVPQDLPPERIEEKETLPQAPDGLEAIRMGEKSHPHPLAPASREGAPPRAPAGRSGPSDRRTPSRA